MADVQLAPATPVPSRGIIEVHVRGAAEVDAWLFGGTLPTEYL